MKDDLQRLTELQRFDNRIAEVEKEIALLPRHVAAIERTLESHVRKLDADRALLAANQKERKAQDLEIQTQQQKMSKLRDQMTSAKTNEQYRAFQHEIEYCEQAIRKCEDRILELMEQSEPLEVNVKAAEVALQKEKSLVEREKAAAVARTAKDKALLAQFGEERKTVAAATAPAAITAYERARRKTPVAVADATGGRCSACQMELRPQFMQDLKKRDQIMLCECCRRILIYNPPVAVDVEMNTPASTAGGSRVDMS